MGIRRKLALLICPDLAPKEDTSPRRTRRTRRECSWGESIRQMADQFETRHGTRLTIDSLRAALNRDDADEGEIYSLVGVVARLRDGRQYTCQPKTYALAKRLFGHAEERRRQRTAPVKTRMPRDA